jgi:release factor glutamine methyltransferase
VDARLLLLHATGWSYHQLITNGDMEIDPPVMERFRKLVERRASREPLQHITGSVTFRDLDLLSGPAALVPRPETEILVDEFIRLLHRRDGVLLDLGTGSGNIALCLATEYPLSLVVASDISAAALQLARRNILHCGISNMTLVHSDLLRWVSPYRPSFDGIAANLPYIPSRAISDLQPEVRDSDPTLALDGGPDGMDIVRRLCTEVHIYVREGGILALELDSSQVPEVSGLLDSRGNWTAVSTAKDLSGRDRFVTAVKA